MGERKTNPARRPLTADDVAFVKSLVIYEDSNVIALNKPAGLSSQGGRIEANTLDDLLAAFARSNGKRPRLIHRLDRDTSGVILAAKTQPDAAFLGKAMMARRIHKTYQAIVTPGAPEPRDGSIQTALRREDLGREAYTRVCSDDHPQAQSAVTRYRTLAEVAGAALLELSPRTGRMHQLRVHLSSVGRPIAGDPRYGGALMLAGSQVPRLMLHAAFLVFPHPAGGERRVEAPAPADMTAVMAGWPPPGG